jgi:DNA-binding MarR family transcriptional regulator
MDTDLDMFEQALGYFAGATTRLRYWETIQRTANVTIDHPSARLLVALQTSSAGYKLHELATRIGIEAPSVTRTVQRLEHDNLVTRMVDPHDRRATYIHITRLGKRLLERIKHAKRKRLESLFSTWSTSDRKQLTHLLRNKQALQH